jgi:hypothetical protein
MHQDDYEKFVEYVENSDLKQSQVVDRAVREHIERKTVSFADRMRASLGIGVVAVTAGWYGASGDPWMVSWAVVLFMSLPFILPAVNRMVNWAEA